MITNPTNERTVFIVGAGGSACLDFPLGGDFLQRLGRPLGEISPTLGVQGGQLRAIEQQRRTFVQACKDTTYATIDQLLRNRPALRDMGAFSIAASLAHHQLHAASKGLTNSTWHSKLYRRCVRRDGVWHPETTGDASAVSVITFNYDLNIELAVARHAAADGLCESTAAAWEYARGLPIVHVHGALALDEVMPRAMEYPEQLPVLPYDALKQSSVSLALSTDDNSAVQQHQIAKATQLLRMADRWVFLGFGFDIDNLKRIGIDRVRSYDGLPKKGIHSTARKLDPSRISEMQQYFMTAIRFSNSDVEIEALIDNLPNA